ncbi:MAG: DUF6776 family protein [Arenicellales bacterium]|jgi:septal ring factor EnvC (AmiA/AmiB activator)
MLRKPTDDLVIKPRMSAPVRLAVVLAAIAVVVGASVGGYWGGRAVIHQRLVSTSAEVEALTAKLQDSRDLRRDLSSDYNAKRDKLEAELKAAHDSLESTRQQLEEAKSSLTKVTRQLQIDQTAYQELRKQLDDSDKQITDLGSELKFYRSIISPADGRSGVRIQDLELEPTDTANEYRYRLTLIQALEHETQAKGTVQFEISGTEGGAQKTIHAPEPSQKQIPADFKYFQNFAGTFTFPADFTPAQIKVIFKAKDNAVVQRTYPWPMHG